MASAPAIKSQRCLSVKICTNFCLPSPPPPLEARHEMKLAGNRTRLIWRRGGGWRVRWAPCRQDIPASGFVSIQARTAAPRV